MRARKKNRQAALLSMLRGPIGGSSTSISPDGPPVDDYAYLPDYLKRAVDEDRTFDPRIQYDFLMRNNILPDNRDRPQRFDGGRRGFDAYSMPANMQGDAGRQTYAAMYREVLAEADRGNQNAVNFLGELQGKLTEQEKVDDIMRERMRDLQFIKEENARRRARGMDPLDPAINTQLYFGPSQQ